VIVQPVRFPAFTRRLLLGASPVLALAMPLLLLAQRGLGADRPTLDVTGYVIDAQLDPEKHTLSATTRVTFTALQAADTAVFELHGALLIAKVTDDTGQALNGERGANATVRVTPTQPLAAGQSYTWTFTYSGAITTADGGPVEGLKLASIADPVSYLLYAGRWFPMSVGGYQTDRFTSEIHMHVPSGYTVIGSGSTNPSTGPVTTVTAAQARADEKKAAPAGARAADEPTLLKRPSDDDEPEPPAKAKTKASAPASASTSSTAKTATPTRTRPLTPAQARAAAAKAAAAKAASAAPATSTLAGNEYDFKWDKPGFPGTIIVGKFNPPVTVAGSPNIKVYALPGANPDTRKQAIAAYAETANQEFAFFTSTFGLPESSRLNVVELPDNTVPSYWAPEIAAIPAGRIGNKSDFRLLANTMAHQWWGSEISPATENDAWITNGMARYGELLYLEDAQGPSALQAAVQDVSAGALAYDTIPLSSAGRMGPFTPEFQEMTLDKGAMVFHMLRWEVGDDSFRTILRAALSQYTDKSIRTSDFEKVAEAQSQQQLVAFFSEWLDGTGAPQFTDKYSVYRLGNNKGFRTIGEIQQDLDLFNMPAELRIETDGKTETRRVDVVGSDSQYVVDTFGRPRHIQVDPNNWLLKNTPDMQVRVSILKGQQLVAQGDMAAALAEYQKALTANSASSLASYRIGEVLFTQRNYQASANAYRDALRGDDDPRWTEVWSHVQLGKIFDLTGQRDRAVNEYRQAVQTNDNTQGALNEARLYLKQPYKRPEDAD
jgi:tetratricopeptide (TPR) repeat protein